MGKVLKRFFDAKIKKLVEKDVVNEAVKAYRLNFGAQKELNESCLKELSKDNLVNKIKELSTDHYESLSKAYEGVNNSARSSDRGIHGGDVMKVMKYSKLLLSIYKKYQDVILMVISENKLVVFQKWMRV